MPDMPVRSVPQVGRTTGATRLGIQFFPEPAVRDNLWDVTRRFALAAEQYRCCRLGRDPETLTYSNFLWAVVGRPQAEAGEQVRPAFD